MGRVANDRDLHAVAMLLSSDESVCKRICSNMYTGGRIKELQEAAAIMMQAKEAIRKRKTMGENALNEKEKTLLEKADSAQQHIIAVDSYTIEDYFKCSN